MNDEVLIDRLLAGRDPAQPAAAAGGRYPASLDGAYRVQDGLVRRLERSGRGRQVGFKIGASSERAQRFLGLREPMSGQVLEAGLLEAPATISTAGYRFCLIEPEFAFRLARDLPPRARPYSMAEAGAAVAALHPAIEVVTSAYGETAWQTVGALDLVADNGAHGCLVLGEGRRDWRGIDLARQRVELRVDGRLFGAGSGAAALGHPLAALAWLASQQGRRGRGLRAGEVVTTGVVTPLAVLHAGQKVEATFGPFGSCRLTLEA